MIYCVLSVLRVRISTKPLNEALSRWPNLVTIYPIFTVTKCDRAYLLVHFERAFTFSVIFTLLKQLLDLKIPPLRSLLDATN